MIVDVARGCVRGLARLVSLALTVAALVAILIAGRLALGPISLSSVAPRLEEMANAALARAPGAPIGRLGLGDAALSFDAESGRLRLALTDIRFEDADGAELALISDAAVKLDLAALLGGDVSVRAAEVVGGDALLRRDETGRFRFGVDAVGGGRGAIAATGANADQGGGAVFAVAARIAEGLTGERAAPPPFDRFERLTVRGLNLRYEDALGGVNWRAPGATIDFVKEPGGVWARIVASVEVAPGEPPTPVRIEGRRAPGQDWIELIASVEGAPGWAIASQTLALDALKRFDGRLSGRLRTRLRLADGALGGLAAELAARDAAIELSADERIRVAEAESAFEYQPAGDMLRIRSLRFVADGVSGAFSGDAALTRDGAGRTIGAEGAVTLQKLHVTRASWFEEPLLIDRGVATLSARLVDGRLEGAAQDLSLSGPFVALSGSVSGALDAQGRPSVAIDLAAAPFRAAKLASFWPTAAAPGARLWVRDHLRDGVIKDTRILGRFGPEEERLEIDFAFDALAADLVSGLPPVVGGVGEGRATLDRFDITFRKAEARAPNGGVIRLDGSRFAIPTLAPDIPPGEADLRAVGDLRAIATLIDEPPLGLMRKFGAEPSAFSGEAAATASFDFPLAKALKLEDITIAAEGAVDALAVAPEAFGAALAAERAEITLDADGLRLTAAKASVDGRDARLRLTERFRPEPGAPRREIEIETQLEGDDFAFAGGALQGSARALAQLSDVDGAPRRFSAAIGLSEVVGAAPALGWSKGRGEPGALRLSGVMTADGGATIKRFDLSLGGLDAEGSAALGPGFALRRIDFSRLSLGDSADLRGVLEPTAGGWRAAGGGARLDLSALQSVAADASAQADAPGAPFALDLTVDELRLFGDQPFRGARIVATRDAAGDLAASLRAAAGSATVNAEYRDRGGSRSLEAATGDAGQLFSALDIAQDAHRGRLRLVAAGPSGGALSGELVIEDIVFESVPPALDALSVGLLIGAVDKAATGGMSFSRIAAPFTIDGSRLTIDEASATGPSMGLRLCGVVDRSTGAIDLAGSLSPAYAVNGIIGEVPLIGDLLTGGSGEGLIGVAFGVTGTLENPDVTVNPLSALTPGFMRRIFSCGGRAQPTRFDMPGFAAPQARRVERRRGLEWDRD